ncbi:hypothetical protein BCR33DRAFT_834819, partial [Rhizoclosmatium globosum]
LHKNHRNHIPKNQPLHPRNHNQNPPLHHQNPPNKPRHLPFNYTTLETQKQNLADMARQIPPLRASLTLTHRRASHTIKHLLTTISTLTQDRAAALQQVETLTRDLKARCGSVSKEGRVLETEAVWRGDDMFGRWCFDRGVGKENAVRMRVGEYERIRRERAERCGAGEGGGKGEGGGEVEDGLVERYQFLVNTVRGVREMFSE